VPRVGKGSLMTFPPQPTFSRGTADPSTAGPALAPPGLAWAVDGKEVDIGLGQSPKDLLGMTRPADAFRRNPSIEHAVVALGADGTFAAILAPPGCCKSAAPVAAPLTLGWGRKVGNGWGSIVIGDELLGRILARAAEP
jgi:hypothetical protein